MPEQKDSQQGPRWRRRVLTVVVLYHLAAIVVVQIPPTGWPLGTAVRPLFAPYLDTVDLIQGWNLFAPNPPRRNASLLARIRFSDGVMRDCTPPQARDFHDGGETSRFLHWEFLVAIDDGHKPVRPDVARWIARSVHVPGAVPQEVILLAQRGDIPPPGTTPEPQSQWQFLPEQTVLLDYIVQPSDLQ